MKIWSRVFYVFGFIFQIIVPIVLFGNVIPYTHESLKAGLTFMGYIAFAVIVLIISEKCRNKVKYHMRRGVLRALLLLAFPVAYWFVAKIGINYILNLFIALAAYWGYIIIFIVIGGLFYLIGDVMYEEKAGKDKVE